MNINRHNYEEFFILYLDNELGNDERRRVEEFVEQNPDLKEELDVFLQSRLSPDPAILFSGKDELMKQDGFGPVTMDNYEEWLVQYMDNELDPSQIKQVEQFLSFHPHLQKELNLFQQTRLEPETIVFPDKESLYRRTEKVRVISISWRRIAVAAIFLLIAGGTALVVFKKKPAPGTVAKIPVKEQKNQPENPVVIINPKTPNTDNPVVNSAKQTSEKKEPVVVKQQTVTPNKTLRVNTPLQQKDEIVAKTVNEDPKPSNNLPRPLNTNTALATIEHPNTTTDPSGLESIKTPPVVTIKATNPSNPIYASNDNVDPNQSTGKKGGLRGFLRKVTRTLEKNTNIDATDDDRLLVGGLAFKLK